MHHMLRIAPLFAALAVPCTAFAQADDFDDQQSLDQFDIGFDGKSSGYFVQVSGILVDTRDQDTSNGDSAFGAGADDGRVSFDTGFGISVALGYEFETAPFQVSVEYTYRRNDIDALSGNVFGTPGSVSNATGEIDSHAIMFNGIFDFAITGTPLSIYTGAGIGFALIDAELDSLAGIGVDEANGGDDTQFAYQILAGLEYQIDEQFTIFAGFRFFDAREPSFDFAEFEYDSLNYELGLRYYF